MPTRIVLCVPFIDASDERELAMVSARLLVAPAELVVGAASWSDAADSPTGGIPGMNQPVVLLHVGASGDFPRHKRFTELADRRFFLEAEGRPTLEVEAAVGRVTTRQDSYALLVLGPADWNDLEEGVAYRIRPRNDTPGHRWRLAGELLVKR